jgi:hypothetical protein
MTHVRLLTVATWIFMLVVFGQFTSPHAAWPQGPCQASANYHSYDRALAVVFPPTLHTGCTAGVPSGAATGCWARTNMSTTDNSFSALWPNEVARMMDSTGGCIFMCASGDCRVGNDGLPVELLQFGVE